MKLFELFDNKIVEEKTITDVDLKKLEEYLDALWAKLGIDIEFSKHWKERLHDPRNQKPITAQEILKLFNDAFKTHGKKIAQAGPDFEAVLNDISTKLNVPFVLVWDRDNEELDLVAKTIMRKDNYKTSDPKLIVGESVYLDEGPHDPHIFKAIFLAGGPGSGKSFVARKIIAGTGLKSVNSDNFFEYLARKNNLNLRTIPNTPKGDDLHAQSKLLVNKQMDLYVDGRLGVVVDGTGRDYERIEETYNMLRNLGYDILMVFVNTSIHDALVRNKRRERRIADDYLVKSHRQIRNNLGKYQSLFGINNLIIVNNSFDSDYDFDSLIRHIRNFLNKQPQNPIAKKWIEQKNIKEEDLKWAIGKNKKYAKFGYPQEDSERMVVWANIKDIFDHTIDFQKMDINDPIGGKNSIGDRVAKAKQHWERQNYMDPSEIHIDDMNRISFSDGRHRLVASYQLGYEWAPVVIYKDQLDNLKKIVRIRQ